MTYISSSPTIPARWGALGHLVTVRGHTAAVSPIPVLAAGYPASSGGGTAGNPNAVTSSGKPKLVMREMPSVVAVSTTMP